MKTNLSRVFFISLLIIGFFLGCSINKETIHGKLPVPNLSDEQLLQEMESIYISLGQKFDKAKFLMAIMPDPAYVLTSSYTSFSGMYSTNMTTYTMPRGYQTYASGMVSGSGITQYSYTDANATVRTLILVAQLVNESKIKRLQERGYSIVIEFRKRAEEKRKQVEMDIDLFFERNPDLKDRKTLLAAILPWVVSTKGFRSTNETLEQTGNVARALRTSEKLSNTWFGTFSQVDRFSDGTTKAWSNFITTNSQVSGSILTGRGVTGAGEAISLKANIKEGKWKGIVTNETFGASFDCEGSMSETELTGIYWGSAWGKDMRGNVVLLR